MGASPSKAEFQQSNLICDFDFLVQDPKRYWQSINHGPARHLMEDFPGILEDIQFNIKRVLLHGDEDNATAYRRYTRYRCCCSLLTIFCFSAVPLLCIALLASEYAELVDDYYEEYIADNNYLPYIIGVICGVCICHLHCFCYVSRSKERARTSWRSNVIKAIDERMQQFQAEWPQFVFTLLYPIHVRIGKQNVIRGRIRVTASTKPQHTPSYAA